MKKTINNTKPTMIVDLTKVESCNDIRFEFTRAKAKAGIPLTDQEINQVVAYGAHLALNMIEQFFEQFTVEKFTVDNKRDAKDIIKAIEKAIKPKTPWYKKVWNWIKKPFVKK
jgi:hypothetical protein